jgi:hypothetical protein
MTLRAHLKAFLAAAAAALVFAAPASAVTYGPYPGGNGFVNYNEAVQYTTWAANSHGWHGGVLRTNLSRYAPWGYGHGQDVELNVRFRDWFLGHSWVSNPCDGAGCRYYVSLYR